MCWFNGNGLLKEYSPAIHYYSDLINKVQEHIKLLTGIIRNSIP
jgi:hypothetical protein